MHELPQIVKKNNSFCKCWNLQSQENITWARKIYYNTVPLH